MFRVHCLSVGNQEHERSKTPEKTYKNAAKVLGRLAKDLERATIPTSAGSSKLLNRSYLILVAMILWTEPASSVSGNVDFFHKGN
jgi:hypothetical protein